MVVIEMEQDELRNPQGSRPVPGGDILDENGGEGEDDDEPGPVVGEERAGRALIVEDDRRFAGTLKRYLVSEGFGIEIVYDGDAALRSIDERHFDIVVLDILLPGVDGFQVCRRLRQGESRIPVVIMTALGSLNDRVHGFTLGADDYIVKPFSLRELVARMHAVLSRSRGPTNTFFSSGDIHVDLVSRRAWLGQHVLKLSGREFDLLTLFVQHSGIVLTRQTIMATVWGQGAPVSSNVVDQDVTHLRKKIAGFGCQSAIETIHRVGWRLVSLEAA
jgi:two-component system OmpR family response regulator